MWFAIPPNAVSPQALVPFTLQPGQVLNALVLQLLDEGQVRLSIANTVMDVVSQVPLTPGSNVRLAVQSTTPVLTLALLPPGAPAPRGTGVPAAIAPQAAADVGEAQVVQTASAQSITPPVRRTRRVPPLRWRRRSAARRRVKAVWPRCSPTLPQRNVRRRCRRRCVKP